MKFFLFPNIFFNTYVFILGSILTFCGQFIRSYAMISCGESFNHFIQRHHQMSQQRNQYPKHCLVTDGIYHYLRHPSYFGYFYWAIGTQIMLCNPFCTVFFIYASWNFFKGRIPYEESTLLQQYPQEYTEYMKRSWIGIPFIPSKIPASKRRVIDK